MKKKRVGGALRMQELGYKQVQVWLDQAELRAIGLAKRNKACVGIPLATLLRKLACDFADHTFIHR